MATRKIRLTLSGTQLNSTGPIVDVDFNSVNVDADLEVTAIKDSATIVKEYTVEADAGTYGLSIDFKNDEADRDLFIENIEIANDGINYEHFAPSESNCNLDFSFFGGYWGYAWVDNPDYDPSQPQNDSNSDVLLNAEYDPSQPRTDDPKNGWVKGTNPGNNPKFQSEFRFAPIPVYTNSTATFNITFS